LVAIIDFAFSSIDVVSSCARGSASVCQPGSAFKPFVYLAALEDGMTPATRFVDEPIEIDGWKPTNYSDNHLGPMRLSEAMAKSINTVAVQVSEKVGRKKVAEAAKRMGVSADVPANPSIALGASNMTLEDLTSAYLPLARGGLSAEPYAITKITDGRGAILFKREPRQPRTLIEPEVSENINHLLFQVMHDGTGAGARLGNRTSVGKTGTTNDWRDAWFIGYTAQMTTGVWVGNDDFRGMDKVTGGKLPAQIWKNYMLAAHQELPRRSIKGAVPAVTYADESLLLSFYSDISRGFREVRQDGSQRRYNRKIRRSRD